MSSIGAETESEQLMEEQSRSGASIVGETEAIPNMADESGQQMPNKVEKPKRFFKHYPNILRIQRIPLESWQIRAYYGIGTSSSITSTSDDEDEESETLDNLDTTSSSEAKDEETIWNNMKEESIEDVRVLLALTAIEGQISNQTSPSNVGESDDEHDHQNLRNLRLSKSIGRTPPRRINREHDRTNLSNLRRSCFASHTPRQPNRGQDRMNLSNFHRSRSIGRTPRRPRRLIVDPRKKKYEEAPI